MVDAPTRVTPHPRGMTWRRHQRPALRAKVLGR